MMNNQLDLEDLIKSVNAGVTQAVISRFVAETNLSKRPSNRQLRTPTNPSTYKDKGEAL